MNPFSKDACCLFKIGGAQRQSEVNVQRDSTQSDKRAMKVGTCTVVSCLVVWVVFGAVISLVFVPYIVYKKTFG